MAYWWVNQGQTYEEEFRGSYLWAPKRTKDGKRLGHWDAMTDVVVDDVIVHYLGKPRFQLRSVSVATEEAESHAQPPSLQRTNLWDDDGWLVRVAHVEDVLGLDRDEAYALGPDEPPFTKNGTVKQGYLWPISGGFAHDLLERMDPTGAVATDEAASTSAPQSHLSGPLTVELEEGRALTFEQVLTPARREAVRAEWQLVDAFVRDRGRARLRRRYSIAGGRSLFADAWFPEERVLVEAKASADRRAIREAIGQLYDYAQKEDGSVKKVVVLPQRPADDLLDVLASAGITPIWRDASGWSSAFDDDELWSPA